MTLLDKLLLELDWRLIEIATLKKLVVQSGISEAQRRVILRAGWALLYAHYEGFAKNSLATFYDSVKACKLPTHRLPKATQNFALKKKIKKLREESTVNFIDETLDFVHCTLHSPATFDEIKTVSNLYFSTLNNLLNDADVKEIRTPSAKWKINNLVRRRNDIAHGENVIIGDVDYFVERCDYVENLMYEIVENMDNRIQHAPYI